MRWRVIGPVLAVVLLAAVVFSLWPSAPRPSPGTDLEPAPTSPAVATSLVPSRPPPVLPPPAPAPSAPTVAPAAPPPPAAAPVAPPPSVAGPTADDRAAPGASQPSLIEDAGVVHALTRDGIKAAIQGELPEIRACYESWLAQQPDLGGKLKVQFTIVEVPGEPLGRVEQIDTADGGLGHLVFEGCVKNVFAGLRFERPQDGVMKVTYPLAFENTTARPP